MRNKLSNQICAAKRVLLMAGFWLFVQLSAHAQYFVQRVYGNGCVGSEQVFVFMGGSSCFINWSTNGTIVSTAGTSVTVKWNSPTSNAYVSANYNGCSSFPYSGTVYSPNYTISNPVTPSVSIVANKNNVCKGTNITFTATPVNGGSSPYYSWRVNGNSISSGSSASWSSTTLNNGDVVSVVMSSNAGCVTTSTATSNNITMNLTNPSPVSVTINGPLTICSGSTGASFYASPTNGGSNPTYTWLKNGNPVNDNLPSAPPYIYAPQNPLNEGDVIKCRMTSNQTCVSGNPAESNQYVVSLTSATTPSVGIPIPDYVLCDQQTLNFTASSSYIIGSSTYSWRLNGNQFSTASSASLPVSITEAPNTFGPGDVVTVVVNGLSGTCLSTTTATGSTSGVPFVFNALPSAATTPTDSAKTESDQNLEITAASGSGYSYQWYFNDSPIAGAPGTANPYTAVDVGEYKVEVTGQGSCTRMSSPVIFSRNSRPIADAGSNPAPLVLPTNSIVLNGSGSDADGSIEAYLWSQVSGPSTATLSGKTTSQLTASNLTIGTYVFQLVVTDDFGEESLPSSVTVTVEEPPNNYNWIRETVVLKQGITNEGQIGGLAIADGEKAVNYAYFDGLGRPMQQVAVQNSPMGLDVVQPIIYDKYGREEKKYLPYTSSQNDGWYKVEATGDGSYISYLSSDQFQFYQTGGQIAKDTVPYAKSVFEFSPLNRMLEQAAPGESWRSTAASGDYSSLDRTVKFAYETNAANEVRLWTYTYPTTSYPLGLVNAGTASSPVYYEPNQLYKTKTKDEQYNEVIEYKDKQGRVVLKRVQAVSGSPTVDDTNYASTYYIYDDFGNLVCVIPPEATRLLESQYLPAGSADKDTFLKRWAFRYTYDGRKRMTQKQVPGAEAEYLVYDDRDRVVLTQNGVLRPSNAWIFTKYDQLNRPILTGRKDTTAVLSQIGMQDVVNAFYAKAWTKLYETYIGNATGNVHGYSNKSYPVFNKATSVDPNNYSTVTYYDDYSFRSLWLGSYIYVDEELTEDVNGTTYSQPSAEHLGLKGQVTGTKVRVFDGSAYSWIRSVNYYDDRYRVIQVNSENYKNGFDRTSNLYDFAGKLLKSMTTHVVRDVTWKDKVGVKQEGNRLIRTASGNSWGGAGAASVQQLPAGTNGWVQFRASETTTGRMIGLSDQNTNASYTTIDFAWYLLNNGTTRVYESGTHRYTGSNYKAGDVFRIERTGTTIKYYHNNVLKYTSGVASSSLLMADMSIHHASGTVTNVSGSFSQNDKTITRRFVYDAAGRMVETWHQVDTDPEVRLVYNQYNELGQLIDKKLHSTTAQATNAMQSVDYNYNIRGWLLKINNSDVSTVASGDNVRDFFGMELAYDGSNGTGNTGMFNGNISGIKWSVNQGYSDMKEMAYNYSYDPMNRLQAAVHFQNSGSWTTGQYDERDFTYDLNGNIKSLLRKGEDGATIDDLEYNYGTGSTASNKLLYVRDNTSIAADKAKGFVDGNGGTATDYAYDDAGNMTHDLNKGIGTSLEDATNKISYNYMNLPARIVKGNNSILNIYDASGRRHAQEVTTGTVTKQTDYAGDFVYENDVLQFINHEEGRIVVASNKLVLKDDGSNTATMTAVNVTLDAYASNGEDYIRVTSNGTTARTGVFPIGGNISVSPGERYRIKVRGFKDPSGTHPVYLSLKANGADLDWPGSQLPNGAAAESWVEQTVTIPAGATTLQAGVTWNTVTSGAKFYINELEITRLVTELPEYQYHLKDHLGNVRVTFTSKEEADEATATLETANMDEEQSRFLRYQNVRRVASHLFDRTNGDSPNTTPGYAQRLNASTNEKFGLAQSISVMPGDKISAEVYAKYVDTNSSNWTAALTTLLTQIAAGTAPAGTVVDGGGYPTSTSSFPFPIEAAANTSGSSETGPKAYLNWLVFDRDYNLILNQCGYDRLSANPKEYGQDVAHERLFSPEITISEPGYVYIYLSNEETTPVEVFFDDFKVEHIKSPIVEAQDYYPFGLTFNSYQRENSVPNRWKFQGQEHIDDLGLNWDSFKWRNHQPDIGRFFNVDPLAEKYVYNSPYAFSENKVVAHIELEGLEALMITNNNPRITPQGRTVQRVRPASEGVRNTVTAATSLINPTAARRTGAVERGSTNISSVSGRIARHVAENGNMSEGIGSERNAFRHALWSASITQEFGANTARQLTNAHEGIGTAQTATVDFSKDLVQNRQLADDIVDILNNEIGRGIAESLGENATPVDMAQAVLQFQRDEGLWTFSTLEDGTITLQQVTISQEQFDEANRTLNTLDNNGFNDQDRQELERENN